MQEKLNSNESKVAKVTILRTTALVLLSNACDCQPNIAIGTVFGIPDRFFFQFPNFVRFENGYKITGAEKREDRRREG